MEEKKTGKVHGLTLKERKYGKLTGVQDIHSFNENEILLQTEAGKVQIKGEQLHVKSLDLEKGEAEIEGKECFLSDKECAEKRRTFAEKDVPVR